MAEIVYDLAPGRPPGQITPRFPRADLGFGWIQFGDMGVSAS